MDLRSRLRWGLIPAVPVPRRADITLLHREAQEGYVRWMASRPVAGAAAWVHTGRGLHLPPGMRREVLRSWRAGTPRERVLVAGAGSRAMAEEAAELGADALLCFPPVPHRGDRERIVAYHAELARAGLPLILFYLYEAAGGVRYDPDTLRALFELPQVVAIKMATLDSVMTFQDAAGLIAREFPETVLITGEDRFLGYSMLCGAQGALIGMGAALPEIQARLVGRPPEAHPEEFLRLTRAVDRFARVTFRAPMEGYVRRMLWALADTGVIPEEAAFDPVGPDLAAEEREEVRRAVAELAAT